MAVNFTALWPTDPKLDSVECSVLETFKLFSHSSLHQIWRRMHQKKRRNKNKKGILLCYLALCFNLNVFIKFMHHLTQNFEPNIIVKVSSMQWNEYEIKQKVITLQLCSYETAA